MQRIRFSAETRSAAACVLLSIQLGLSRRLVDQILDITDDDVDANANANANTATAAAAAAADVKSAAAAPPAPVAAGTAAESRAKRLVELMAALRASRHSVWDLFRAVCDRSTALEGATRETAQCVVSALLHTGLHALLSDASQAAAARTRMAAQPHAQRGFGAATVTADDAVDPDADADEAVDAQPDAVVAVDGATAAHRAAVAAQADVVAALASSSSGDATVLLQVYTPLSYAAWSCPLMAHALLDLFPPAAATPSASASAEGPSSSAAPDVDERVRSAVGAALHCSLAASGTARDSTLFARLVQRSSQATLNFALTGSSGGSALAVAFRLAARPDGVWRPADECDYGAFACAAVTELLSTACDDGLSGGVTLHTLLSAEREVDAARAFARSDGAAVPSFDRDDSSARQLAVQRRRVSDALAAYDAVIERVKHYRVGFVAALGAALTSASGSGSGSASDSMSSSAVTLGGIQPLLEVIRSCVLGEHTAASSFAPV